MEQQNCLGIYLSAKTATAVSLASVSGRYEAADYFTVSADDQEQPSPQMLAGLIAEGCTQRGLVFSELAVALDCAVYTQHNLRTGFTDPGQIARTIKFDAEETLATDASDLAVAFNVTATDQTGSDVTLFAAQRKILLDILAALQSNNLDPVTIEPDVICLTRFLWRNIALSADLHPLFALLSQRSVYLIAPGQTQDSSNVRTFLIGPSQDRAALLARQIPVTLASFKQAPGPNCLKVFDAAESVDCRTLAEKIGIATEPVDLAQLTGTAGEALPGRAEFIDFAIACGAALTGLTKTEKVDFRPDFMPYQGRKVRLQKALKVLSISVSVLLLAVGLYFQLRLLTTNRYCHRLRQKLQKDYAAVMFGKKLPSKEGPAGRLKRELIRIRKIKSGQLSAAGEDSVSAMLTYILEAINQTPDKVDLSIDSISVSPKSIVIAGDTNKRGNTIILFDTINRHPRLTRAQSTYESKAGRDKFRVTVALKK